MQPLLRVDKLVKHYAAGDLPRRKTNLPHGTAFRYPFRPEQLWHSLANPAPAKARSLYASRALNIPPQEASGLKESTSWL